MKKLLLALSIAVPTVQAAGVIIGETGYIQTGYFICSTKDAIEKQVSYYTKGINSMVSGCANTSIVRGARATVLDSTWGGYSKVFVHTEQLEAWTFSDAVK